jgi:predicted CoA-binding protein
MARLSNIQDFLSQKRIALVGLSRKTDDFSHMLKREFEAHGVEVVPVHAFADSIDGEKAYQRVQDIPGEVGGALVLTSPQAAVHVVRDCEQAGIRRVWLYKGGPGGAVSEEAVALCDVEGIACVAGECPFMFFEDAGFLHKLHGAGKKLLRTYPT